MPALIVPGCRRLYTVLGVFFQFETLHYPWIPSYTCSYLFKITQRKPCSVVVRALEITQRKPCSVVVRALEITQRKPCSVVVRALEEREHLT